MSLHSYSSVVKRIDRRVGSLEKFLGIHRRPMVLREMNSNEDLPRTVQRGVEELAARTARCYQAFSNPVFTRSVRRANAERLKWVQMYSLREFKYCVALQEAAAQFAANAGSSELLSVAGDELTTPENAVGAASLLDAPGPSPVSSSCFLRNTDDHTYVDEAAATALALAHLGIEPTLRDLSSSAPEGGSTFVASDKIPPHEFHSTGRSSAQSRADSAGAAAVHATRKGPMTRAEAELALETGDMEPTDLPFDLALEMLRPQQSVLDVLVNEAALQSDQLNNWFSRFCRRRVAWRVLHEHLLHLLRPDLNPRVVYDDTDVVALLQSAGNTVADIYAKLDVSENELVIQLEEDPSVLTCEPQAAYVTSSVDCITRTCEQGARAVPSLAAQRAAPSSASIYSVEGHLGYVFREILKNACVATVRWSSDVSLIVRFAVNECWVVVDFVDHAGGISPQNMRNIWKFGWTTSEHYESHLGGFGVGLPTSKVYMDMWGASIDVFSTVGEGTTVRVRYPKSPTEALVHDPPEELADFPNTVAE